MVADLERVDKNRRVRIPQRKAQREGCDLDQIGDNSKNRKRSGSENSNLDKVLSKFEEKFKKIFLENQTGFHHRPKQEIVAHQQSKQRSAISSPKLLRKIFGKTCHEFVQQADLRRLLQVKLVAIVVPGLSTTSCSSSSSGITSNIFTAGKYRLNTDSSIH